MSEEERDLERRLDAAFASLRPRRGFEDELRARLQARRGWAQRLRDALSRLGRPQLVPGLSGVAALLMVALVAFVVLNTHRLAGGAPGASAGRGGAAVSAPNRGSFGALPAPALKAAASATAPAGPAPAAIPYTGPANLHWTGVLPDLPTSAPVLRFDPPPTRAVAAIGASAAGVGSFTADIAGPEPRYVIDAGSRRPGGTAPPDDQARATADNFLGGHNLAPAWPNEVVVVREQGGVADVFYYRNFEVPGAAAAQEVDQFGSRTGIRVLVGSNGGVYHVEGPIPVALQGATYTLRQADSIVGAALAAAPSTVQTVGGTMPDVNLSQARMVYIAVAAGGAGFYEPAVLFTGTFLLGKQLYEKRVLVPALDPSLLRP